MFLRRLWGKALHYDREGLEARRRAQRRPDSTANIVDSEVALIVLEHELKVVQRAVDASQTLETKANGLAVLDLALIGVLATVAVEHWSGLPLIATFALAAFLASLFFAWRVNQVEAHNLPAPVTYNLPTIANNPNNAAKIAQELTEAWDGYATDERNAGALKAIWLKRAFATMYIGTVAFAIVAAASMFASHSNNERAKGATGQTSTRVNDPRADEPTSPIGHPSWYTASDGRRTRRRLRPPAAASVATPRASSRNPHAN